MGDTSVLTVRRQRGCQGWRQWLAMWLPGSGWMWVPETSRSDVGKARSGRRGVGLA